MGSEDHTGYTMYVDGVIFKAELCDPGEVTFMRNGEPVDDARLKELLSKCIPKETKDETQE